MSMIEEFVTVCPVCDSECIVRPLYENFEEPAYCPMCGTEAQVEESV